MRILKLIYGVVAGLIFILSFAITTPLYFLVFVFAPKDRSVPWAHRYISYNWARFLLFVFGVRLRIHNAQSLDKDATYVFIANHRTQMDIPVYAASNKHIIKFLAKKELTNIPLMGYIIKNLYISVDRSDKKDRNRSLKAMMDTLKSGISVFLAPEGTRNKTDKPLLDFRDGAFRLAIEAQVPLAVLTIKGADKINSVKNPLELTPGTIDCFWSDPIITKGMKFEDLESLKNRARELMLQHLQN